MYSIIVCVFEIYSRCLNFVAYIRPALSELPIPIVNQNCTGLVFCQKILDPSVWSTDCMDKHLRLIETTELCIQCSNT